MVVPNLLSVLIQKSFLLRVQFVGRSGERASAALSFGE